MNKKYDIITKQSLDQLAQSISDMTYLYEETNVPKKHYKDILNEVVEEEMQAIVTMNILNAFTSAMIQMKNESPSLFYKAILCTELKISTLKQIPCQEQAALCFITDNILSMKKPNIVDSEILEEFNNFKNDCKSANDNLS